jgi:EAL and modified HD-GYP domain-containing signal transduction protein
MQDSPLLGQILLGYAPIVGAGGEVSGLRLALMPDQPQTRLDAAELLKWLAHSFPGEQTPSAGAPLQLLINIVSESLLDELMGLNPPPRFGLELPAFMTSGAERSGRFRDLNAKQVSLVAKGWAVSSLPESLLQSFRALIVDAADEDLGIDRPPSNGPRKLDTYIEGVHTTAELELAFASGAVGVLGLPADDEVMPGRMGLAPELSVIIELMQLAQGKGSFERMQALMQSDAALAARFVRLVNSPAFGWRVEVPSFAHAFLLLGPGRLMRWLALLLVWSVPGVQARPLAQLALRRALAMAALTRAPGQEDLEDLEDEMFICGVLSLLDRMTGLDFQDLVDLVPMPARVQASITGPAGPYARHLNLLAAVEQASFAEIGEAAHSLMITQLDVNRAIMAALAAARRLEA